MDPEVKILLKENLKLSKENNELLKKVRGFQKWSQTAKAIYWFIIIAFAFGAWYFVQPYLETLLSSLGAISGAGSSIANIENLSDLKNIQSLLEQIQ